MGSLHKSIDPASSPRTMLLNVPREPIRCPADDAFPLALALADDAELEVELLDELLAVDGAPTESICPSPYGQEKFPGPGGKKHVKPSAVPSVKLP